MTPFFANKGYNPTPDIAIKLEADTPFEALCKDIVPGFG